ncbi:MAG: c-type cytochrome [Anaerolineae bacterium]|nr:c-type cytochrome [Anaerolineae bacterium]
MAENVQSHPATSVAEAQESYKRFGPGQRFEHVVLLVTFSGLALTGLPQSFAEHEWAKVMIDVMGGIESIRIIHRILATILMAEAIYHGGLLTYKLFVLGRRATMIPGLRDIRDVLQWIAFNLGLRREHPHLPRYNFGEKVEYLAVVWGTVIMVITGFMMWNPIATTNFLPGSAVPAARVAHSAEALLAVLSIVTWHMWNVHIRRFNRSMFTGRLPHDAMEEEHAEELDQILAGQIDEDPSPQTIAKRNMYFFPYAFIVGTLLVLGLLFFVTFEQTAITTVDPAVVVQTDQTLEVSADEGNAETGAAVWASLNCSECHGDNAQGGEGRLNVALANTALSFEDFVAAVRRGPADMKAYSVLDVSDLDLAHLYAWLQSQ